MATFLSVKSQCAQIGALTFSGSLEIRVVQTLSRDGTLHEPTWSGWYPTEETKLMRAAQHLKADIDISLRDAKTLVILRDGPGAWCDICRTTEGPFFVDHDHMTRKPRGLLCRSCNTIIGRMEDGSRPEQFITYLREASASPT